MSGNHKLISAGGNAVLLCVLVNAIVLEQGFIYPQWGYKGMLITLPLFFCSLKLFRVTTRTAKHPQI